MYVRTVHLVSNLIINVFITESNNSAPTLFYIKYDLFEFYRIQYIVYPTEI